MTAVDPAQIEPHLANFMRIMSGQDLSTTPSNQQQPISDLVGDQTTDTTDTSTTGTLGSSSGAGGVVGIAQKYLGVPYVYGGVDPKTGLDCSGLVQLVFGEAGIQLPRTTYDQVKMGTPVAFNDLQPGDLVFSVGDKAHVANGHVGIYMGNGQYIVAPHTGTVVQVEKLPSDITAIRRV